MEISRVLGGGIVPGKPSLKFYALVEHSPYLSARATGSGFIFAINF